MRIGRSLVIAGAFALTLGLAWAMQTPDHQQGLPDPVPPPLPRKPPPKDAVEYEPDFEKPSDGLEWGLPPELLEPLYERAEVYRAYTRRFTCDEEARVAEYDSKNGSVSKERVRRYGYLLRKSPIGEEDFEEFRQEMGRNGNLKAGEVLDEEPFPPAYEWVFLFSRFNEPYFSLAYLGDRFEGFDWVYEIYFKGSLSFTSGKDIREWEGTVLIDAVNHTPLEIRAEPAGQKERIEGLYRNWNKSFSIVGMRTAPKPFGYRAHIQFSMSRDGLRFPTQLRYDTFRAVSLARVAPIRASTRRYDNYRIQRINVEQQVGDTVNPK
ncbi:MAG: hypothetical protein GY716_03320 [bacterium]|nr:hypothetical protein [bacterium]